VVALDEVTTRVMSKYFDEQLPLTEGITLGFKQILAAKNIVLMATGLKKAEIVKQTVKTKPTNQLPATVLKLAEKEADFYLDEAAASLLRRNHYEDKSINYN
jgi:6-phosphogluconolactonase/glucosamine-6-phosphate isomerase/deaminase